jgi:ELP3 family radical SAM enzyme/protein acetyltransferase
MRSDSGVLVVTIVTKPGSTIKFSCPEKCAYCPTETDLNGNPTQPKSYISSEPAMLRALQHNFEIKGQINDRLKAYLYMGNMKKDNYKKKIEVILSGGTWDVMPKIYREQVMNEIYWGFNTFDNDRPIKSLEEEIKENEISNYGVIGLTIETRPDYINKYSIMDYRRWGVTRVQIGVQHFDDNILKLISRGCTTQDTINAIKLLKSVGLKVVVHLMPDLPGSNKEKDILMFKEAIENSDLQFDDIKIYPCAVIKSDSPDRIVTSEISKWYEEGKYKPYSETNINDLIVVCKYYKLNLNPWVRIERLIRDIPAKSIDCGYNKISNLRQIISDNLKKYNLKCNCIRCMEIKDRTFLNDKAKLVVRKYIASDGIEYHISYEVEKHYWTIKYIKYLIMHYIGLLFNKKIWWSGDIENYIGLFGFLRLRIDKNPGSGFINELKNCGLIREVHVYGQSICVGDVNTNSSQHRGYGRQLVKVAEEIVKSHKLNKVAIISGIGAREYYKNKCGYELIGTYMIKNI